MNSGEKEDRGGRGRVKEGPRIREPPLQCSKARCRSALDRQDARHAAECGLIEHAQYLEQIFAPFDMGSRKTQGTGWHPPNRGTGEKWLRESSHKPPSLRQFKTLNVIKRHHLHGQCTNVEQFFILLRLSDQHHTTGIANLGKRSNVWSPELV